MGRTVGSRTRKLADLFTLVRVVHSRSEADLSWKGGGSAGSGSGPSGRASARRAAGRVALLVSQARRRLPGKPGCSAPCARGPAKVVAVARLPLLRRVAEEAPAASRALALPAVGPGGAVAPSRVAALGAIAETSLRLRAAPLPAALPAPVVVEMALRRSTPLVPAPARMRRPRWLAPCHRPAAAARSCAATPAARGRLRISSEAPPCRSSSSAAVAPASSVSGRRRRCELRRRPPSRWPQVSRGDRRGELCCGPCGSGSNTRGGRAPP